MTTLQNLSLTSWYHNSHQEIGIKHKLFQISPFITLSTSEKHTGYHLPIISREYTGGTQSHNEMPRFFIKVFAAQEITSFNVAPLSQSTAVHCSGGRRDPYHGSYQLLLGACVFALFCKWFWESLSRCLRAHGGTQSQCSIHDEVPRFLKMTVRGTMVRSEVCNSWCFCLES